jgi:hypothetical protein
METFTNNEKARDKEGDRLLSNQPKQARGTFTVTLLSA